MIKCIQARVESGGEGFGRDVGLMGANLEHFSKKNEMRGTVLEQIKGLNAGMKTDGESVSSSCSGQSKEEPQRASESKEGSHCIIDIDIMMGGGEKCDSDDHMYYEAAIALGARTPRRFVTTTSSAFSTSAVTGVKTISTWQGCPW